MSLDVAMKTIEDTQKEKNEASISICFDLDFAGILGLVLLSS